MAQAKCALCHIFMANGAISDLCGRCKGMIEDRAGEFFVPKMEAMGDEISNWKRIASQRHREVDNRDRLIRTLETRRNEIKAALDETGGQLIAARTELSHANATIERMKYASRRETVVLFLTHLGALIVGGILAVSIWEAMAR